YNLFLYKYLYKLFHLLCIFEKQVSFIPNTPYFLGFYNPLTVRRLWISLENKMQNHAEKQCNLHQNTL
ncbi:hypothetical protein, partial [Segatella oris]|uniref:hypothetical protein n=1 Tax=Segatella oris TaxID=28135 RepID=UPI00360EA8E1